MAQPKNRRGGLAGLALILCLTAGTALAQELSQGFNQDGEELFDEDGNLRGEAGIESEDEPSPAASEALASMIEAPKARLRGLDTLTNTVNDFEIEVGQTLAFKRLIVTLKSCRYPPDDPLSDALAFLVIQDRRDAEPRFSGWMLASSPAFSALDHPRYDIWVLSCSAS